MKHETQQALPAQVFDTLLSVPGMQETVKIQLVITRKNVLVLSRLIALAIENPNTSELAMLNEEVIGQLRAIPAALLEKAGLTELDNKLKSLSNGNV